MSTMNPHGYPEQTHEDEVITEYSNYAMDAIMIELIDMEIGL